MKSHKPLLLLILLVFYSCGNYYQPVGHPPASKAFLITPGISVGNIKLEENMDSVLQILGKPDSVEQKGGKSIVIWFTNHDTASGSISIYEIPQKSKTNGRTINLVKKIAIADTAYRTQDGIGSGDSLINIARIFIVRPYDTFRNHHLLYTTYGTMHGITFVINPKGICQSVIVHSAKDSETNAYKPFY